ncbi:MAG TPA: type I DNA topoisomerase [Thermoanaerobaculia bacterium]|nr:type I DNA topoisomerase [Thermoanaerobaculia bacterium]
MAKNLVIVESPAKAKTINKFIGKDFTVKASVGHIRDLPKKEIGVDETTFEPRYEILEGKAKVVSELKSAAKSAETIYIASDPDREGEAIGWHVMTVLGKDASKVRRILFHEITKNAVLKALEHPLEIDMNKVNAQQARRVLDRLVGYKLSPLLWDKVRRGLSAGRVQSVALKMIVDREEEIRAFVPQEYWTFAARLEAAASPPPVVAKLTKIDGKKAEVPDETRARAIEAQLKSGQFVVEKIARKEKKQSSPAPFITSKLQQEAYRRFKYPVKRTMQIAQKLYEGKELGDYGQVGLITYMRTDSPRVSDEAIAEVRNLIGQRYGADILPEKPNVFKVKKSAQEAHEAIRPTSVEHDPEKIKDFLTREEYNLYKMIFERFVASQMKPALFDVTDVDVRNGNLTLRVSGEVLKFAGFLSVFQDVDEDEAAEGDVNGKALPRMEEGEILRLLNLDTRQNFTQPPPRFTEATLVKALEENGIGRPSTYGAILTTIQTRDYTYKDDGKFVPTELGMLVTRLLKESFDDIIDEKYTARLEEELDEIEEGKLDWKKSLGQFSKQFEKDLERARSQMTKVKGEGIKTDEICDKCGAPMAIKFGRFGEFLACTNYPECKTTRETSARNGAQKAGDEQIVCDKCGKPMTLKRSRFGQFYACSGYPECRNTKDPRLLNVTIPDEPQPPCENCGKEMVLKGGRYGPFYSCSGYPECKTIRKIGGKGGTPAKPTGVNCPKCKEGELVERRSRRGIFYSCSRYPKCDFSLSARPVPRECPRCAAPFLLEKETKREGRIELCNREECDYRAPIAS